MCAAGSCCIYVSELAVRNAGRAPGAATRPLLGLARWRNDGARPGTQSACLLCGLASDPCVDDSGPGGARLHTGVQWRTELEVAVSRLCCSGICLFVLVEARGVGSRGYYTVDLDESCGRSRSRVTLVMPAQVGKCAGPYSRPQTSPRATCAIWPPVTAARPRPARAI